MTTPLRPFFSYYGAKWRIVPLYPTPAYGRIVEPFAGSAAYATTWHASDVTLIDSDEVICGVWDYLIHVSADEVRSLPILAAGQSVADVQIPQEARWLIGFWLNQGTTHPCLTPSKWVRDDDSGRAGWSPAIRERVARQVDAIRHWRVIHGGYQDAPDVDATWMIDPPYQGPPGRHYRYHDIDYDELAAWCRSRPGQVIVCEQRGATWLPFRPLARAQAGGGSGRSGWSDEVVWAREDRDHAVQLSLSEEVVA
jgi:hypothetical protein